jgi:hypothetical protein
MAFLVVGLFVVVKHLHGQVLVWGFLRAYLLALPASTLFVLLVLPPRYAVKPGQVPRLFGR